MVRWSLCRAVCLRLIVVSLLVFSCPRAWAFESLVTDGPWPCWNSEKWHIVRYRGLWVLCDLCKRLHNRLLCTVVLGIA